MGTTEEFEAGVRFIGSIRGQYIMAQFLRAGIKAMEAVPEPYKQYSNIADAKWILENVFNMGQAIEEYEEFIISNGYSDGLSVDQDRLEEEQREWLEQFGDKYEHLFGERRRFDKTDDERFGFMM